MDPVRTLVGTTAACALHLPRPVVHDARLRQTQIGRDGRLFTEILKREHVPLLDVERALREADCDLKDVKYAFLEADGNISILKSSSGAVKQETGVA